MNEYDTREQLEKQVRFVVNAWKDTNFDFVRENPDVVIDSIFNWLDRQEVITKNECRDALNAATLGRGTCTVTHDFNCSNCGKQIGAVRNCEMYETYDEWQAIAHYQDDKGYLLPTVEYYKPEICDRMRDRVFEDMFIKSIALNWDSSQEFNPALIAECMQPFKINGICPSLAMLGERLEFAGHNNDVSIKVLVIGVRK